MDHHFLRHTRSGTWRLLRSEGSDLVHVDIHVADQSKIANHRAQRAKRPAGRRRFWRTTSRFYAVEKIIEGALKRENLMDLESIKPLIDVDNGEDAADYVIDRLAITKGGDGGAKDARSLRIAFSHTSPEESQKILEAILLQYQDFITGQLESVMSKASDFINEAKDQVESDLRKAEQEYLTARKAAPLLFQGVGSSNVYQDKYRRLEEELLAIEIEESSLRTRLEQVEETLKDDGKKWRVGRSLGQARPNRQRQPRTIGDVRNAADQRGKHR